MPIAWVTAYWIGHRHWILPKALQLFFKIVLFVNFVPFQCQNCHELHAFLGVNIGLKVLLRVKELTFCNSGLVATIKYVASGNI